jgi:hypothetical protein
MMGHIKSLSAGHPVAEVFLIGFAFAYLVEGAWRDNTLLLYSQQWQQVDCTAAAGRLHS